MVTVLDISSYSYVNQDLAPSWFARLFGQKVYPNALQCILNENGIPFVPLISEGDEEDLPPDVMRQFDEAVFSEMVTYFRTNQLEARNFSHRITEERIRARAKPIFTSLCKFLTNLQFERVLVPNGRASSTRLSMLACKQVGVKVEYFEIGRALENSYYLGTQQIHDREGTQSEVEGVTGHLSVAQIQSRANAWLAIRMTSGLAIHPYGSKWRDMKMMPENVSPRSIAAFFSSSVDELTSYGERWQTDYWSDQYEAFDSIIRILTERGVTCVLRIHPNLVNKSSKIVRQEFARIRELRKAYPKLHVISPTDPTNSYDLLRLSKYVVVGRSTLGLEGSCLGKCVWVTSATRYDAIADVKRALSPSEVSAKHLRPWSVDPLGAQRFVSYWVEQDHVFRYGEEHWSTWDSLKPPITMRIGNLFVKNSLFHKYHLLRLEATKLMNRLRSTFLMLFRSSTDIRGMQFFASEP